MEHKEVYSRVLDIHKHIFEQLKFAEKKSNILLAFLLSCLTLSVTWYFQVKDSFGDDFVYMFGYCIAFVVISIIIAIISFFPNLFNKEKHSIINCKNCNIYFFKDLANMNSEKLLEIITKDLENGEKYKVEQDLYIKDMLNQIHVMSSTILNKYKYIKLINSILSMLLITILMICFIVCYIKFNQIL